MQKIYQLFANRGSKIYRYNGDYVFSSFNLGSGQSSVKLHLEGALGISPGIVADYSLFHGYEFGFVDAAQFIDLKALLDVKITQEMYCPVFSLDIPIPKLGAVRVGIYLVLDVDGDITLTVKAEEGVIASASVYGSTKFGIPTSFHINKGFESFSGAECDPMVQDALARLPSSPERGSICCFVLNPAGTASEEAVLDMLDEALSGTGIPVFGGSASSEVCARGSVSLNGGAYSSSSVFVLMQLAEGCFRITQENIFRPMGRQFRVTKANLARRTLYELDGQPAADVLCGAMNVQKDALAAALAQHPFGLALDGQLLINEVERVNPDGSITAYCRFFEGSTVSLLEPREFAETMDISVSGEEPPFASGLYDVIYAVCKEAHHNTLSHSLADRQSITAEAAPDTLTLSVFDNGHFHGPFEKGFGLSAIEEKVRASGGTIRFHEAEGESFGVVARWRREL